MTVSAAQHAHPPLALAPLSVLDCSPVPMARLAALTGFKAIGLRLFPAYPGSPVYPVPVGSEAMRDLQTVLDGENVSVLDVEFILVEPGFVLDRVKAGIESAAELGAQRVNIAGDDPDAGRLTDHVRNLVDFASAHGLHVDIEPMAWRTINSYPRARSLINNVDHPRLGLLTDCLHFDRTGATPDDLMALPSHRRKALQLCDAHAMRPATMEALLTEARSGRLLPGQGALPLLDILDCMPPDVALSIECPLPLSIPAENRARQCFAAAQQVLRAHQARNAMKV